MTPAADLHGTPALSGSAELIPHTAVGRMLLVLDLDPVRRSAGAIWAIAMLRNHALQPHQARMPEQIRACFALLKVRQEDPVDATRQQPGQVRLAAC